MTFMLIIALYLALVCCLLESDKNRLCHNHYPDSARRFESTTAIDLSPTGVNLDESSVE